MVGSLQKPPSPFKKRQWAFVRIERKFIGTYFIIEC